jgi:hypothetical protein
VKKAEKIIKDCSIYQSITQMQFQLWEPAIIAREKVIQK